MPLMGWSHDKTIENPYSWGLVVEGLGGKRRIINASVRSAMKIGLGGILESCASGNIDL